MDVEGRSGLVIAEHQVPGQFVRLDPLALQRRRQVEHHHVRLVMSENGGYIVPADRVRPCFEKGFDPVLFGIGVFRHGFGSFVHSEDEQRGMNPTGGAVVRPGRGERRRTARKTPSVGGEAAS